MSKPRLILHSLQRRKADARTPAALKFIQRRAALVARRCTTVEDWCCWAWLVRCWTRQINALAAAFTEEGGFTERLYRIRTERRNRGSG